jgi:hypothetical protein
LYLLLPSYYYIYNNKVRLGPNGVEEVLPFGKLTPAEQKVFDEMLPDLVAQVRIIIDIFIMI